MGSGFSSSFPEESGAKQVGLGDLPENCLAMVLEQFEAPEICKLGRVNQAFYRASCADVLWESKLPENYGVLVKKLVMDEEEECCKKHIYARLCRPVRISGGTKEVWSEKRRGGICMLVSWKGMKITGIHDRRYWTHIPTLQSRFRTIAYLRHIWWLEVEGDVDFDFPTGNYGLYFRLQLGKPNHHKNQQVHGWTIHPVHFKFSVSNGQNGMSKHVLNDHGKWVCYHVGDFDVEDSYQPTKINFSMTQIDCTHQKGGLSLDSVLICPRGIKTHTIV